MISSCWVVAQSNPTISPLSLDLLALLGNGHQLFGWNEEYKTVVKTWEKTFGLMMACEVFIWVGGLATRSRARRMLYEVTRPKTQVRNEKKKKRKPIMIDQSLLLAAKKAHPSMPWIRCVCVCIRKKENNTREKRRCQILEWGRKLGWWLVPWHNHQTTSNKITYPAEFSFVFVSFIRLWLFYLI